jgi:hypothetical protein
MLIKQDAKILKIIFKPPNDLYSALPIFDPHQVLRISWKIGENRTFAPNLHKLKLDSKTGNLERKTKSFGFPECSSFQSYLVVFAM